MRTLLPANATAWELATENALKPAIIDYDLIKRVTDPQTCPVELLPLLAFAASVDYWNDSWPEQVKRNVIENSPEVHRLKSTVGGLQKALDSLGFDMQIIPWFKQKPKGERNTARCILNVNDNYDPDRPINSDEIQDILRMINANKRLRVHIDFDTSIDSDIKPFVIANTCQLASNTEIETTNKTEITPYLPPIKVSSIAQLASTSRFNTQHIPIVATQPVCFIFGLSCQFFTLNRLTMVI